MILFYILLGYLLFRFVMGFVVPVFRTTKKFQEQFSQMNPKQPGRTGSADDSSTQGDRSANPSGTREPDSSKVGEYIDFEEVKS